MQLDRVKPGIVSYKLKPGATFGQWSGQFYTLQSPPPPAAKVRRALRSTATWDQSGNVVTIFGNYSATTSACMFCQPPGGFLFAESEHELTIVEVCSEPRVESSPDEPRVPGSPVLEMRSTRRSLRDKAREEMSDFEREYPW